MSTSTNHSLPIRIKKVSSLEEMQACFDIRKKVFVEGQNVPLSEELDGKDESSDHYLLFLDEKAVGVSRVRYLGGVAKIERVAILEEYQGRGLGKKLMSAILSDLKVNPNVLAAKLGAQTQAVVFYEKLGFMVCSGEYMEAGIPHKDMQLILN